MPLDKFIAYQNLTSLNQQEALNVLAQAAGVPAIGPFDQVPTPDRPAVIQSIRHLVGYAKVNEHLLTCVKVLAAEAGIRPGQSFEPPKTDVQKNIDKLNGKAGDALVNDPNTGVASGERAVKSDVEGGTGDSVDQPDPTPEPEADGDSEAGGVADEEVPEELNRTYFNQLGLDEDLIEVLEDNDIVCKEQVDEYLQDHRDLTELIGIGNARSRDILAALYPPKPKEEPEAE